VLAFYPADWSPVCGDQMALYNELLSEFRRFHATVIGISVDGAWCHAAFALDRKLHFPLLADFEPKGGVARLYGVYQLRHGISDGHPVPGDLPLLEGGDRGCRAAGWRRPIGKRCASPGV
jgi:peroxiredoxin